jgi:hypothetical protein
MLATEYVLGACQIAILLAIVAITLIPICKRRGSKPFLCGDCRFNSIDYCHKSKRPYALECTSYRSGVSETGSGSYDQ